MPYRLFNLTNFQGAVDMFAVITLGIFRSVFPDDMGIADTILYWITNLAITSYVVFRAIYWYRKTFNRNATQFRPEETGDSGDGA